MKKEQDFHASDLTFRVRVKAKGKEKTVEFTVKAKDNAAKKFKEALADADETLSVEWTHRHYVQDDEYIPHGEDIEAFLKREIAKPIIRWERQPATRLRNPAEQILLPLPAAHAREGLAGGVLEAGEGGGEDAGGIGEMMSRHIEVDFQVRRDGARVPSGSAELRMEGSTWYGNVPTRLERRPLQTHRHHQEWAG